MDTRITLRVLWIMPGVCGKNQGIGGHKCRAPPNSAGVWARLIGWSHAFRRVPNSEVWVGQLGPIYRDGTWQKRRCAHTTALKNDLDRLLHPAYMSPPLWERATCIEKVIRVISGFSAGAEIPDYVPNLEGGSHRVFHRCRILHIALRHVCDCMTHYICAYSEYSRGACHF